MNEQSSLVARYNSAKLLLDVIHFSFSLQQCETKPVSQSYESHCIVADGWKLIEKFTLDAEVTACNQ